MILLIDGNNLANMCFYVAKKTARKVENNEGMDVTMINVFMSRLYTFYDTLYPDSIIICWDKKLTKGVKNFRNENDEYKANRPEGDNLLYQQCDLIETIVSFLGIRNIHPNIMEADDAMAWIAHNATEDVLVASFDKDLLQLVSPTVDYYDLRKRERITTINFEEKVGVMRRRFLLYKMILGDRSDNIPGLKGYGKIKSKRLAEANEPFIDLTLEQKQLLARNKKLMDLTVGYNEYPDEIEAYEDQLSAPINRDFSKFITLGTVNNIPHIRHYKWKWEDLCLNSSKDIAT